MPATLEDTAQAEPSCLHHWRGEWLEVTTVVPLISGGKKIDLIALGTRWFRFRGGIIDYGTFIEMTDDPARVQAETPPAG